MKRFHFVAVLLVAMNIGAIGQFNHRLDNGATATNRLFVWEFERVGDGAVPLKSGMVLCSYEKKDKAYIRTEVLRTGYRDPYSVKFYDRIVDHRYLITEEGDVVDLQAQKVIHEHNPEYKLKGVHGDSVFFEYLNYDLSDNDHRNDSVEPKTNKHLFYYVNIRTGYRESLSKPYQTERSVNWSGVWSPGKKYRARFDPKTQDLFFLYDSTYDGCAWARIMPTKGVVKVHSVGDKDTVTCNAVFNYERGYSTPEPIFWYDETTLLSQVRNGDVILIDMIKKSVSRFPPLANVKMCSYSPYFNRDSLGNVYYICPTENDRNSFKVNVDDLVLEPSPQWSLSQQFAIELKRFNPNSLYGVSYLFNDEPIISDNSQTTVYGLADHKLAFLLRERLPSRNRYDHTHTIVIFDAQDGSINKINIDYFNGFLGWY